MVGNRPVLTIDYNPIPEPGDMNGDGLINENDVNPFVLALTDRMDYESLYPWIDVEATGDVNDNGSFDFGDVRDFKLLVSSFSNGFTKSLSASSAIPEPSSPLLCYFTLGALLMMRISACRR